MKPSQANPPADLLTRYPREAGADLLSSFQNPSLPLQFDCTICNRIGALFLPEEQLQQPALSGVEGCRKRSPFNLP
jgi:hypothetical protein